MLLSPRTDGLDSLSKEVRVFKVLLTGVFKLTVGLCCLRQIGFFFSAYG